MEATLTENGVTYTLYHYRSMMANLHLWCERMEKPNRAEQYKCAWLELERLECETYRPGINDALDRRSE